MVRTFVKEHLHKSVICLRICRYCYYMVHILQHIFCKYKNSLYVCSCFALIEYLVHRTFNKMQNIFLRSILESPLAMFEFMVSLTFCTKVWCLQKFFHLQTMQKSKKLSIFSLQKKNWVGDWSLANKLIAATTEIDLFWLSQRLTLSFDYCREAFSEMGNVRSIANLPCCMLMFHGCLWLGNK